MITWHYINSTEYKAAPESAKTSDKLFFLSDTGEIYRGTQRFSEAVSFFSNDEAPPKIIGRLFIHDVSLEGKIWNGTEWKSVIKPVVTSVNDSNTTYPVTGKAVADYVSERIRDVTGSNGIMSNVTYTAETNSINVIMADGSSESIPMTNVAADLVYDTTTGKLQVKNASGTAIGSGINLDLERFVSAASYDHETRKITLSFNAGDPLTIDVGDLVDTYTADTPTDSINMTVSGNKISAEVRISNSIENNQLCIKDDGLYVLPTDISGKIDKVVQDDIDQAIPVFTSDGNITSSGMKVGGATIGDASYAGSTLATESAVIEIRNTLQNNINNKIGKVATGKTNEILIATESGEATVSGVKIGGEVLADSPSAATVATEKAVQTYVGSYAVAKTDVVVSTTFAAQTAAGVSDTKVASEKAVFDSMSWKTTV